MINIYIYYDKYDIYIYIYSIGATSQTIAVLRSLYTNNHCIIKCDTGTSQPFAVKCGLRQGCPLSTTLFNLYIHDLHHRLAVECARTGIQLPHHPNNPSDTFRLRDLGYADDIALLATNHEHLQQLLDTFQTFCIQHGLQVNTSKCEIVVFSDRRAWRKHSWFIAGREIARVDKFKYLGVTLQGSCRSGPTLHAIDHRLE